MLSKRAVRRRKEKASFDRWIPRESSSWAFQVYKNYNVELEKYIWAYIPASQYTYAKLKSDKAQWADLPTKFFYFPGKKYELFKDLKSWSNAFNDFDNWVNLSVLMAISSTFETYLATIISIALQSDPGILLNSPKSVDGVYVLKYGSFEKLNYNSFVESCTKGDWNSRISFYEKIFQKSPPEMKSNLSDLEGVRKIRNNIGHAFGRDIEDARNHAVKKIIPMERLTREKVLKYQKTIWNVAKEIDKHLLYAHIGEYQSLNFYHNIYPPLRKDVPMSERAMIFKKRIGQSGVQMVAKDYCKELVKYYESL